MIRTSISLISLDDEFCQAAAKELGASIGANIIVAKRALADDLAKSKVITSEVGVSYLRRRERTCLSRLAKEQGIIVLTYDIFKHNKNFFKPIYLRCEGKEEDILFKTRDKFLCEECEFINCRDISDAVMKIKQKLGE